MAVISVVKLSELEGARRIDAEYYQPEYLMIDRNIKRFDSVYLLGHLIYSFSSGKNLPQIPYNPKKPAFIRTQNVRPILICEEGLTSIDISINESELLKEGDILFVRVGEGVGNSSIVTPSWAGNTFSDNVIRVKIKELNPYFVITYLNSKVGSIYLERVKKGSARSLISKENIAYIKIFKPTEEIEKFCKEKILKAQKFIDKSIYFYSQAESLLLSELGLQNFKPKEELFYKVSLSETSTAHRIDAEYFNPKYDEIIEKINEKTETKPLSQFIISVKKGIEVGSEKYQDEGIHFIRVSNLSPNGFIDKDQKYISEEDYQLLKDKFEPKEGEILLTKDATPGIAYFIKEPIKGIISSGILRLKIKNIDPEYLCLCINSIIGKSQIERDGGGSIITHWKPNQIKNLLIPILPSEKQQEIAELVQKSHEARKKAKQLLEEAKKKVEEKIYKHQQFS